MLTRWISRIGSTLHLSRGELFWGLAQVASLKFDYFGILHMREYLDCFEQCSIHIVWNIVRKNACYWTINKPWWAAHALFTPDIWVRSHSFRWLLQQLTNLCHDHIAYYSSYWILYIVCRSLQRIDELSMQVSVINISFISNTVVKSSHSSLGCSSSVTFAVVVALMALSLLSLVMNRFELLLHRFGGTGEKGVNL